MPLLTITCPACGERRAHHSLARSEYSPVAPQVLGGILWALVFVLSRKRRFRCGRCAKEFFCHTPASMAWLALWVFFCACLVIGIAIIFLSLLFS